MNDLIERILVETDHHNNPYFAALRAGEFEKADFVETQIQFYHAVVYFFRPMAALAAKTPGPLQQVEILRNVWEENGEGDPARAHGATFLEFLARLDGVTAADVERRALWPEVRIFNAALAGACAIDDYLVGCATMGMIERMFCEISSWIGHAVVRNGWIAPERLVHYDLHEELDVRHAQDFFDVLRPAWAREADRYTIEQGLRMGAAVFDGLYRGLFERRKRRAMRPAVAGEGPPAGRP
jgi:pyrroloquinoline quinone (PQQ) biosynthesis protein C